MRRSRARPPHTPSRLRRYSILFRDTTIPLPVLLPVKAVNVAFICIINQMSFSNRAAVISFALPIMSKHDIIHKNGST